jgi:uncharacterized protein YjdB
VNKTAIEMYIGDKTQVVSSPVGTNFKWYSRNEAVAKVNQDGLVEAIGEGATTIIVESGNDQILISVKVRIFVPTTDITLSKQLIQLFVGEKLQVFAFPVPIDASESILWTSANPNIATVTKSGIVVAQKKGKTTITASSSGITKTVSVEIPELYLCIKTGWTVEVSDEAIGAGMGKNMMIDGNYDGGQFWHSMYSPDAPLPHWAVIDMKESVEVVRIATLRRGGNADTKSLQYFIGDNPDANAGTWTKIAEGAYPSRTSDHTLTLNVAAPVSGRYLKLVLPDSFRSVYTAICEIDVWGQRYE